MTVVSVTASLATVEEDRLEVEMALVDVVQGNADNATLILANTNTVTQLQTDIEKQTVVADYI